MWGADRGGPLWGTADRAEEEPELFQPRKGINNVQLWVSMRGGRHEVVASFLTGLAVWIALSATSSPLPGCPMRGRWPRPTARA